MVYSSKMIKEDWLHTFTTAVDAEGIHLMFGTMLGFCEFTSPLSEDSLIAGS